MLVKLLTFMHLFLCCLHGEVVECKQHVIHIWSGMLFLTSVKNLDLITKHNLISCTVGTVFAAYHIEVINLSAVFEEPAEHMFAKMQTFSRCSQ
jgi:hypothetical protein